MTAVTLPSPWVARWAGLIPPGGPVLDLAAGAGRHSRYLLEHGHPVTALDRDLRPLEPLAETSGFALVQADLEDGSPWPLPGRSFAGVVVTNYLWRPILPQVLESLGPGGVLIYETFAVGQEKFGKPSNPDFLLRPGELLELVRGKLLVRAYEHGLVEEPRPAMRQRLCALREAA